MTDLEENAANLKSELMEQSAGNIKSSVQNNELRLGLFRALPHGRVISLVCVQLLLNQLGQVTVTLIVGPE